MSWQDFIKAVAKADFEFPWQRPLIVAQAILESGRGTTDLSHYNNMNGMKYRESIAIPGAEKFQYYTDSENDDPNHPGWDWFFKFDTYETGIKVWQKLFFRKDGDWVPYPKVYERDPEILKDARSFINYIGRIYCPFFENSHNESYPDYIINRCFPEAEQLLREVGTSGQGTRTFKVAIMPGHGGYDPGAVNQDLGVEEAEYNWREAEEIKRSLEQDGNYQVTICRSKSEDTDLGEFQERVNETHADVCLCLHHNSNDREEAKGWWLFSSKQDSETDKFIQILDKHFRELPLQARGYTYATPPFSGDRAWLKRVWNCINACQMPVILFESCFISNNEDCQWLKNGGYKEVVQKICEGVREYLQSSLETTLYTAVVNDPEPPLNVRSGAGTTYPAIGQLNNGTSLEIVEDNRAGWVRISSPIKGWVAKRYTQRLGVRERLLHLVRTDRNDEYGCKWLILSIHNGDFNPIESINVVSGIPSKQNFETGSPHNQPGCCQPLPQGKYSVQNHIDWAGGEGNYNASFGQGLGPVWVPIEPLFNTPRRGFGFHLDSNRINSPGSKGCIVFTTLADLKRFVCWFDDPETAPKSLTVDWGL
jgi:N-acetylmuramoyl-L-alanine amidase